MTGFLFSVFSGIIIAVFTYIYFTYLSPGVYQQVLDLQRQKLVDKGLSSEQIDTAMSISKKYGPLITMVSVMFGQAIMGAVISLIGAAIFKKDKPVSFGDGA